MLWVLVVPFCIGILFNFILPRHRRTIGITYILGFLSYMAVFEVISIACMLNVTYSAFTCCTVSFTIVSLFLGALGIVRSIYLLKKRSLSCLTLFPGEAHRDIRDFLNPRSDPKLF